MQLLCVGDVALSNENGHQEIWKSSDEIVSGDQARILFNWELPVGDTVNPMPRSSGPRLLAHPDSPNAISQWAPGFATLATNHILDAGKEGLVNTLGRLNRKGFATVGAGQTQEEINKPLFWETYEGRLAVINWVFPETHPDWMVVPGPNCWPGMHEAERIVGEVKREADWVLVVAHWSDEHFSYPRPEDRFIGRHLAMLGVDLVIGHHPHVVRGMELVDACYIFYSVGNFYFSDSYDYRTDQVLPGAPRNREGLGVQISFKRGKEPECRLLSFWQKDGEVGFDPLRRAVKRVKRVSRPLRRLRDAEYAEWYATKRSRFDKWGSKWHFGVRRLGVRGTAKWLLRFSRARLQGGR
jgi:hypothetical protein